MRYQREVHRPLLMAIPETKQNVRRFIVNYPTDAPEYSAGPYYDCIVEAWFDSLEDMNALYQSENFLAKVDPDHKNFMNVTDFIRMVVEEDPVIG